MEIIPLKKDNIKIIDSNLTKKDIKSIFNSIDIRDRTINNIIEYESKLINLNELLKDDEKTTITDYIKSLYSSLSIGLKESELQMINNHKNKLLLSKVYILEELLNNSILKDDEKFNIKKEIENLKNLSPNLNKSFSETFKDFLYSIDDIKNAKETKWLIENIIPSSSIGLFFGNEGSGKSVLMRFFLNVLLESNHLIKIHYIDAEMNSSQLKNLNIHLLQNRFKERFFYYGKDKSNIEDSTDKLYDCIIDELEKNQNQQILVIEDSFNRTAYKNRGFIDVEKLYKKQQKFKDLNGTVVILHHKNKSGDVADSKKITDYADYTFDVSTNLHTSSIIINAVKASRYEIESKAFKVKDRKILNEIDIEEVDISENEIKFINHVKYLLEDEEMNESKIISDLIDSRILTNLEIGRAKARNLLKKWSEKGKWYSEKRPNDKNSTVYFLDEKLKNSKNCKTESNHE